MGALQALAMQRVAEAFDVVEEQDEAS
jgi:hypothetical protein